MRRINNKLRSILTGLKNLVFWFKVIWQDRNWDQNYIYTILHKKLELMEKFYRSDNVWGANAIETAEEIREAKDLVYKLLKNDYLNEALTEYHCKYGEDDLICEIDKDGKLIWTDDEEKREMFSDAGKASDVAYEKDRERLFDLIKDKINGWWD